MCCKRKGILRQFPIILLTVFFLASCQNGQTRAPYSKMTEIGNMRNLGLISESPDGQVYFVDLDSGDLKQKTARGSTKLGAISVLKIFLCDETWIYVRDLDTGNLVRVHHETGEIQQILNEVINELVEMDGIFYATLVPDGRLCSFSLDESSPQVKDYLNLGINGVSTLTIYQDELYFEKNLALYSIHNKESPVTTSDMAIQPASLYVLGNYFYYINNNDGRLYCWKPGSVCQIVSEDYLLRFLNVIDQRLVFVAANDGFAYRTFEYDPEQDKITRYHINGYGQIFVANGCVYELSLNMSGQSASLVCLQKDKETVPLS